MSGGRREERPPKPTAEAGSAAPRFGIAYFGVRDLDHAAADLDQVAAQGFTWVLLPLTQDDATWEGRTFRELVAIARGRGLQTIISPWGGRSFGGEGVETGMALGDWLERARDTGADALHVDEPREAEPTLERLLDQWGGDDRAWLTMQPHRAAELPRSVLERVAVLGTDAYEGDVEARVAATAAFGEATGRLDLAWVQAFRIPAGSEPIVGEAVRAMARLAPHVGVWAWRGSTGRGELRSDDPNAVQAEVARAIAEIRQTRTA